jgi:phosphohistidine phosphatase
MKKLLIIRHAKSSWDDPDLDDHERPLNKRGERDSFTMARFLADNDEGLEVIYSSTAIRALDFAQVISEFCDITLVPELSFYTFDEDELMQILRSLPDSLSRVAVVAHNPAVTQLVNRLSDAELENVPTAGVASIECDIDEWADLTEASCEMVYFKTAKNLR